MSAVCGWKKDVFWLLAWSVRDKWTWRQSLSQNGFVKQCLCWVQTSFWCLRDVLQPWDFKTLDTSSHRWINPPKLRSVQQQTAERWMNSLQNCSHGSFAVEHLSASCRRSQMNSGVIESYVTSIEELLLPHLSEIHSSLKCERNNQCETWKRHVLSDITTQDIWVKNFKSSNSLKTF